MIDKNSPKYKAYFNDQYNDPLTQAGEDQKYLDYLTKKLLPGFTYAGAKILDIGAGKFLSWDYFKENFRIEIRGIDVGKDALDHAKKNHKYGMIPCDAHEMAEYFDPNSFDLLISFHAIEHMLDLPDVLKQCYKVLKPGGYFYFSAPSPSLHRESGHYSFWNSNSEMLKHFTSNGFKVIHEEVRSDNSIRPEMEAICLVQK